MQQNSLYSPVYEPHDGSDRRHSEIRREFNALLRMLGNLKSIEKDCLSRVASLPVRVVTLFQTEERTRLNSHDEILSWLLSEQTLRRPAPRRWLIVPSSAVIKYKNRVRWGGLILLADSIVYERTNNYDVGEEFFFKYLQGNVDVSRFDTLLRH